MTDYKIFYSWQSDLPNSTNRGFIQIALEKAVKSIHNDDAIAVEPVIDRDTSGVPGSPDIANTIFSKIDQAQVFVCDISIINSHNTKHYSRLTPNPNVLLELGYAIKSLGAERIIMLVNTHFGKPEDLPFDLRLRRVTTYKISPEAPNKAEERNSLSRILQNALNNIINEDNQQVLIDNNQVLSLVDEAIEAVEEKNSKQELLTTRYVDDLILQIKSLSPDFRQPVSDDKIIEAINESVDLAVDFARLTESIAIMNSMEAANRVYKGFEKIANLYELPIGFQGVSYRYVLDFYKFLGHELFVIFISFLIREERWELISELLKIDLYLDNPIGHGVPDVMSFTYICQYLESFEIRKQRLSSNRISIHADLINERHTKGELSKVVPMQQFIDADCFLILRTELNNHESVFPQWPSNSLIFFEKAPRYLMETYQFSQAEKLLEPLRMPSVKDLKEKMSQILPKLEKYRDRNFIWGGVLGNFDPTLIGSKS